MRTTIDLPEELLRQAQIRAALKGLKLEDLIVRYLEQGLKQGALLSAAPLKNRRSKLPIARTATGRRIPALTNAEMQSILDEEEIAGGRRD